jgi:hypothetical protein
MASTNDWTREHGRNKAVYSVDETVEQTTVRDAHKLRDSTADVVAVSCSCLRA